MRNHLTERLCISAVLLAIASSAYADPIFSDNGSCIGVPACISLVPKTVDNMPFDTSELRGPDRASDTNNAFLHVYVGPSTFHACPVDTQDHQIW
jgi:hypothetical protein